MDDKKNYFIAALVVLLLISAVWGQKETGQRRQLAKANETLEAQLRDAGDAVTVRAELQSEGERLKEAQQQTAAQLENARKKIEELQTKLSALEAEKGEQTQAAAALHAEKEKMLAAMKAEQEKAMAAAEAMKQKLAAACDANAKKQAEQMTAAKQQIAQQQAVLEDQEQKLASAAAVIKQEQKQVNDCAAKLADQGKLQAEMEEMEAAAKQLEEERNKILDEAETLGAQVIGLERIVEERSAALDKTGKELESCKINTSVLIARIAEQEQGKPKPGIFKPKSKTEQPPPQKQ